MLSMLVLGVVLVLQLLSEGSVPSRAMALGIRDDVVAWATESGSGELPATVIRLNPLDVQLVDGGVLLIFHRRLVEHRGYFYAVDSTAPPDELQTFCKNLGDDVYFYYDPG